MGVNHIPKIEHIYDILILGILLHWSYDFKTLYDDTMYVGVNHIPKFKYIWYINFGNEKNTSSLKLWL